MDQLLVGWLDRLARRNAPRGLLREWAAKWRNIRQIGGVSARASGAPYICAPPEKCRAHWGDFFAFRTGPPLYPSAERPELLRRRPEIPHPVPQRPAIRHLTRPT